MSNPSTPVNVMKTLLEVVPFSKDCYKKNQSFKLHVVMLHCRDSAGVLMTPWL